MVLSWSAWTSGDSLAPVTWALAEQQLMLRQKQMVRRKATWVQHLRFAQSIPENSDRKSVV